MELNKWADQERIWSPRITVPAMNLAVNHLKQFLTAENLILDVGSGQGQIAGYIAQSGATAVGIDVDPAFLSYAHNRYSTPHFIQASGEALPFKNECFDGVFSYSTFQYTERKAALAECARVLKKRGRFACVENLAGNPVAKAFRLWAKISKHQYSTFQIPKNHLRWSEQKVYEQFFSNVTYQPFYITTPLLASLNSQSNGFKSKLFSAISGLDELVLKNFAFAKRFAWLAVICGEKV